MTKTNYKIKFSTKNDNKNKKMDYMASKSFHCIWMDISGHKQLNLSLSTTVKPLVWKRGPDQILDNSSCWH